VLDYAQAFRGTTWFDVLPRSAARPELAARVLLHAGPPFRGPPPEPVVNAAIQALCFEGLASDIAAARDLLRHGRVQLEPAQDHGIATPLAQVVSASMLLVAVRQQGHTRYAPIVEGAAPALRFGSADPDCRRRLEEWGAWTLGAVAASVHRAPLAVDEVIRSAVAAGDECHARTGAATQAMVSRLSGLDPDAAIRLRANAAFVLPVLMAAAAAALAAHDSTIEAVGGNGVDFGVRRRGEPRWRHVPAEPPHGPRFPGLETAVPLGAIGDSAVIDFCGLGGQALPAAPLLAAEWGELLPADALRRREVLVDPHSGIVDPARIVRAAVAPLINLAIIDRRGALGLIGRGFYAPPPRLFSAS
jgi:hypothetical protein